MLTIHKLHHDREEFRVRDGDRDVGRIYRSIVRSHGSAYVWFCTNCRMAGFAQTFGQARAEFCAAYVKSKFSPDEEEPSPAKGPFWIVLAVSSGMWTVIGLVVMAVVMVWK